jgi:hypothetical protein
VIDLTQLTTEDLDAALEWMDGISLISDSTQADELILMDTGMSPVDFEAFVSTVIKQKLLPQLMQALERHKEKPQFEIVAAVLDTAFWTGVLAAIRSVQESQDKDGGD